MDRKRKKTAAALAVSMVTLAGGLSAPSAAAAPSGGDVHALDTRTWTRSCGTTYRGIGAGSYAATTKIGGGSCKGDAWLRMQVYGVWWEWEHHSHEVEHRGVKGLTASQHKGCADCTVYTTYP